MPWILNGIWDSPSLKVCREMLDGETGACFAVLTERWNQLMFGFKYPTDIYWRPGLAFVLLFFAAAPVLFFDLPRKLLIITGCSRSLPIWLIWGGAIWALRALLGFVAGTSSTHVSWRRSFALGFFGGHCAAGRLDCLGYIYPQRQITEGAMRSVPSRDLGGFHVEHDAGGDMRVVVRSHRDRIGLGRQSSMPLIKWICVVFIEFIRGVPLITLLFVATCMLAYLLPTRCEP